jgi:hypothetical protein
MASSVAAAAPKCHAYRCNNGTQAGSHKEASGHQQRGCVILALY